VFLEDFNSFLSIAATTPHKFVITGDFNIHLDNPTDHFTSQFLSLLSSFNLAKHVVIVTAPDSFATGMDRRLERSVGRGMNGITLDSVRSLIWT